jgi:hypothetical protein
MSINSLLQSAVDGIFRIGFYVVAFTFHCLFSTVYILLSMFSIFVKEIVPDGGLSRFIEQPARLIFGRNTITTILLMKTIRTIAVALAATFAAGLLFVNIYNSVVDAPNWGSDLPRSIETARDYFRVANPGTFFRLFSPAHQLITLVALILCWRAGKPVRYFLAAALVIAVAADAFTFGYFYPRLAIIFGEPVNDIDMIRNAWAGWSSMNWVRSAIIAIGLVCDFAALARLGSGI